MTNYERIKNMSVEEMAALWYGIIHERDVEVQKSLDRQGISTSLVELAPAAQIEIHKKWLESEVTIEKK